MQKKYQEEMVLRTCDCDLCSTWRPSAILEAMQEVAGKHSEILGCGHHALMRQNMAWVLSRMELHMQQYPRIEDRVTVETFPMENRRCFFPRYFVFRNEAGDVIGSAGTLWLLMDLTTRRIAPGDAVVKLLPDNRDLLAPIGLPALVEDVTGVGRVTEYQPVYTDLDCNDHVNNTRYADWLCNDLGIETMAKYVIDSLYINYDAEVRRGQRIDLHLTQNGESFSMTGVCEDKRHFEIGGTLRERD